ncbi:porin [Erythrobacter sp. LQ02-29]|uniref:OprO/OprP family phosphate-selective porin n=1 Tax=Erythrobacter sp. LQ02-29 TaxID=2920384 RepID=UPI001F4EB91A|nr:porin [Erythrobacter sp. LQ02-29]MCP9222016.1 porin [Erythrobacter sp. LQ02-29]
MKQKAVQAGLALAAAAWVVPAPAHAQAQAADDAAVREQIAQLRAEMAQMAQRLEALEGQLAPAAPTAGEAVPMQTMAAAPAPTPVEPASPSSTIAWKGAPVITGPDGWSFKPRGRLQFDAGTVSAPDATGVDDGYGGEVRRARLGVQGDMPGGFGYKLEIDVAHDTTEVTDALITWERDGATVTVGQQNPFQGLEELTSSLFISHLERAAFTDAFGFERRLGVSLQYARGDVLVQGGIFNDNIDDLPDRNWSVDGRVVYLPRLGETQLHLGASIHHAGLEDGSQLRYRQRPLVHFIDQRFIDTRAMLASAETGVGLEAAAIAGRFHVTGETYWQRVDRPADLADPTFFGGYAEVGYFLTRGDHRGYKAGIFDRVKPARPVGEGGIGAVQATLRYDRLDLSDAEAGIAGGTQDGYIASLIWTPTDYTRLMLTYARLQYDDAAVPLADGGRSYGVDSVGVRGQIDF